MLGGILLALIGGSFYLARQTDKLMPEQLARLISYATGGLYRLERGRARTLPLGRRVEISDVRIVPDSVRLQELIAHDSLPDRLFSIQMKKLHFTGIRWEDLWSRKVFSCKGMALEGLTVRMETGLGKRPFQLRKPPGNFRLAGAEVEDITAEKMNFSLLHHNGPDRIFAFSNDGLLRGTALQWVSGKPMTFEVLTLTLGKTSLQLPHTQNEYSAAGWQLDLSKKVFRMSGFRFRQRLPDSVRGARYQLDVSLIEAHGLRKMNSTSAGFFALQNLKLFEPRVTTSVTREMGEVLSGSRKDFPEKLLQKVGLPLQLQQVDVIRGAVTYEETRRMTGRTGIVSFSDLSGRIQPIWLAPPPAGEKPRPILAALSGHFQNQSLISITASLSPDSLQSFVLRGKIARLNGDQIQQLATNLGHLRIQKLLLDSAVFAFSGNAVSIHNNLILAYRDLSVQLLRYDTTQKRLRQQPVLSLLANQLILHPANPLPGQSLRRVATNYIRPEAQPFFAALWRSFFTSITEAVIADPAFLAYVRQKAATRLERQQERLRRREDRKRRREERRNDEFIF